MLSRVPERGTNKFHFNAGRSTHPVDVRIMRANLAADLASEIGEGWYAAFVFPSGRGFTRGQNLHAPAPDLGITDRLIRVAVRLNTELHHNGHWITGWSANRNLHAFWRDGDGDLQISWRSDTPEIDLAKWTDDDILSLCERAWAFWRDFMAGVDVRPEQTIKAALGERPRGNAQ